MPVATSLKSECLEALFNRKGRKGYAKESLAPGDSKFNEPAVRLRRASAVLPLVVERENQEDCDTAGNIDAAVVKRRSA